MLRAGQGETLQQRFMGVGGGTCFCGNQLLLIEPGDLTCPAGGGGGGNHEQVLDDDGVVVAGVAVDGAS